MGTLVELVQTFSFTFFALVINAVVITIAEFWARTKTNTSATPEDDNQKVRMGMIPPVISAGAPAPMHAAAIGAPVIHGSHAIHVDGPVPQHQSPAIPGLQTSGPNHVGHAALNTSLVKPESVARANNAHNNATENFAPYIMAVVPYIIAVSLQLPGDRDDTLPVIVLMSIFTFARWCHTICYLAALQPWRTVSFLLGFISMIIIACYSVVAASKVSAAIN